MLKMKKMEAKVFNMVSERDYEEALNDWLEDNSHIEIISFSMTTIPSTLYRYTATLIFRRLDSE